jgi:hypothetical protein
MARTATKVKQETNSIPEVQPDANVMAELEKADQETAPAVAPKSKRSGNRNPLLAKLTPGDVNGQWELIKVKLTKILGELEIYDEEQIKQITDRWLNEHTAEMKADNDNLIASIQGRLDLMDESQLEKLRESLGEF